MALRSVLDIAINDSAFKRYQAQFDKYTAAVDALPSKWNKIGNSVTGSTKTFGALVNSLVAQNYQAKQYEAAQKAADRLIRSQEASWKRIARFTHDTSNNIVRATENLIKWVGPISVVTGLLGAAGGLFGLDRMAASVAGGRRSAMGLGIGYGQQSSFSLNYGRFVDAPGMLGNVSNALYNSTSPGYVGLLGAGLKSDFLQSHDAADVSSELLKKLPQLFAGTPKNLIGARAHALNLDQIISNEDIVRYLGASPGERNKQAGAYSRDAGGLDLDARTQRSWTDFLTQMDRAGAGIENTFVKGLTPLTGPLEKLSMSIEHLVASFLGSEGLKMTIDAVSSGLDKFSKYLASDEVKDDVKSVGESLSQLVTVLKWGADKIKSIYGFVTNDSMNPADDPNHSVGHVATNAERLGVGSRHGRGAPAGSFMVPVGRAALGANSPPSTPLFDGHESPDQIVSKLEGMRDRGEITSQECVALAAAAAGKAPGSWNVHNWRRGASVFDGGMSPGTPVSTFLNPDGSPSDRYAGGGSGTPGANRDHAGVFEKYIRGKDGSIIGFDMAEQYAGSGGVHSKSYMRGAPGTEGDAGAYFGIKGYQGAGTRPIVDINNATGGNTIITTNQAAH